MSAGGGGGGGGLYGGGGGGAKSSGIGGGGGGGSSFATLRARNAAIGLDATGSPKVTLSYNTAPDLVPAPAGGFVFGDQAPGTTSASQRLTLSNAGSEALNVSGMSLTGANPREFAYDSSCPASLAVGESCTVFLRFAPVAAGARTAALRVASNDPSGPLNVALIGQGAGTGAGGGGAAVVPAIDGLSVSPRTFRAAARGASTAGRRPPIGTRVSYRLNTAATVRFRVTQSRRGYRSGRRCVKRRPRRGARRCTRTVTLGRFSRASTAGANTFRFTGRLKGRKLRRGRYKLVGVPGVTGRVGKARSVRFKIVRR
jgi:hypothetical protein